MNPKKLDEYGDVLTVEDLMEILRIGRNSAYKLVRSGEIRSFKIGTQFRIPKKYLEEFLDCKEVELIG